VLSFLADENFNADIVRGLLRRQPDFDVVTVQDVGLAAADDPAVLEWAAANGRIVVTHDVNTMPAFAFDRVAAGLPMPGVVAVAEALPIGPVIEDLLILSEASLQAEWENQVIYLPIR
jgi:Domain of unknown function (DUF5615)